MRLLSTIAIGALSLACATPVGSIAASTIVQTQLRGASRIFVHVTVTSDLNEYRDLGAVLRERLEGAFVSAGLSVTGPNVQTFYVDVRSLPVACGLAKPQQVLFVRARLTEPVALKRDASIALPQEPAVWWAERLVAAENAAVRRTIEETVDSLRDSFLDEWKLANKGTK